jgi:hypothetical protein
MSNTTVLVLIVPLRLTVPVFDKASVPVPEIVLLTDIAAVWLNCSVPFATTFPVTLAPLLRSTVLPGAIVPPE